MYINLLNQNVQQALEFDSFFHLRKHIKYLKQFTYVEIFNFQYFKFLR